MLARLWVEIVAAVHSQPHFMSSDIPSENSRITILLVEDHPVIRAGLQMFLGDVSDFEVIGCATTGEDGVDSALSLKPDIILMDVGLPVLDGIEASRRIRAGDPSAKIIMLTSRDSEQDIFAALSAGANGYCLKDTPPERLCAAVRCVHSGDLWLDAAIAGKVLGALPKASNTQAAPANPQSKNIDSEDRIYGALSARELEVLQLLVEGLSNTEIADRLIIGRETVKTHVKHIMDKLAVNDRVQAAVKALKHGLI